MNLVTLLPARRPLLWIVAIVLSQVCLLHAQEPFIVSTVPANGATGVSPSAPVVITFSEQMDITLTEAQFFDSTTFAILPVSSDWSTGNRVLTCTPVFPFPSNRTIFWIVEGENLPGDPLEGETSGFFTTGSGGGGGTGSGTNQLTSFTVGKIYLYNQTSAGAPTVDPDLPYNFTATVTLSSNRSANSVTLTLANGSVSNLTQNFLQPENFFLFATAFDLTTFQGTFPNGNQVFNVAAATSNQQVTVNLPASLGQPNAPHTTSFEAAQAVNPTQPFQLSWDTFQGGTAGDFISVSIGQVFATPDAGTPGALNGTATSVQIPAATFQPDSTYPVTITFYRTVTTSNASYTTSAFVSASTDFDLTTSSGVGTAPLVLANHAWSGGVFSFDVMSSAGQSFIVEYSATMITNSWQTLLTTNSSTGSLRITHPTLANPYLFYRARKVP